jgi:hypothetical protein
VRKVGRLLLMPWKGGWTPRHIAVYRLGEPLSLAEPPFPPLLSRTGFLALLSMERMIEGDGFYVLLSRPSSGLGKLN